MCHLVLYSLESYLRILYYLYLLTIIADRNAPVHSEVEDRHDDAQQRQEDPVLAEPCKRVPPYVTWNALHIIDF